MVIKEIQKEVVWVDYMDTEIMETMLKMEGDVSPSLIDENHKAFKDPLHVPVGPITKARSKKIKEALNGLIQEIWADSNAGHSKLGPKEDEGVINLIQAIEG